MAKPTMAKTIWLCQTEALSATDTFWAAELPDGSKTVCEKTYECSKHEANFIRQQMDTAAAKSKKYCYTFQTYLNKIQTKIRRTCLLELGPFDVVSLGYTCVCVCGGEGTILPLYSWPPLKKFSNLMSFIFSLPLWFLWPKTSFN